MRDPANGESATMCGECANEGLRVYRDMFEAFGIRTQDISELAVEMSAMGAICGFPDTLTSSETGKCGECGKEVSEPVHTA